MASTRAFLLNALIFSLALALSGCSSMLYYPTHETHVDPKKLHLDPQEIWLTSNEAPSGKIRVWYFRHTSKDASAKALLLFFHGNGQNMTSHYTTLGFVLERGYDFAIFDYRGYGLSAFSDPGEKPSPRSTVEDGVRFLQWGHALAKERRLPWVVYAQSLGGAVALRSVIETKDAIRPDLVVVDSTFASYREAGASALRRSFITWPFQWLPYVALSDEWAPGSRIAEISPTPLWVLHGNADESVNYALGREVYRLARMPKEFWHLEGGIHIDSFWLHEGQFKRKFILKLDHLFAPSSEEHFEEYGWSADRQNEVPIPDQTYVYTLPYPSGSKSRVLQGFDGGFSHQDENRYAIDFSEPEGSPVCAIRDGEVIQFKSDSSEGGPDSSYLLKANFILIRHDDGTIAEYYHLKKDGVAVKVGQKVKAGERIGLSGQTGFTTEPHLHVAVFYLDAQKKKSTVPIVFDTAQAPALRLESGESYARP